MSEASEKDQSNEGGYFKDHLVVRHPDGRSEKFTLPEDTGAVTRIGRELDNDLVLTDARSSRYHATIRRTTDGLEIKDLNSANGTVVGTTRLEPDTWTKMTPGQIVQLGETRIFWEKAASSQSTVMMSLPKQREDTVVSPKAPPVVERPTTSLMPWAIGLAVIVLLLIGGGIFLLFVFGRSGEDEETVTQLATATPAAVVERATDASLTLQTPGGAPTDTPTPTGPQLAIPVVNINSSEVRPIVLGALPSTDKALLLVNLRVQNIGNAPFIVSTKDFSVRVPTTGQVFPEAGGTTSPEGLRRLGATDRFDNLNLTPGGSVAEDLIFELPPESFDLELLFQPPAVNPIVLGLGTVHVGRDLAAALGTPVAEETLVAAATTPTAQPSPTPTRPAAIPAPQVVSRSALVGTIAYGVFNGADYDLYFGRVDSSGNKFFRPQASQPAFSPNGKRLAFHSWSNESRGLMTMDVSGANPVLITNFVEDQLPTWLVDGKDILFLTRRSGGRQSQLIRVDGTTDFSIDEGIVLGEGEYPTIGANGQLVFKGWGATAYGLRLASPALEGIQTVTNVDEDTAPALSPDGTKVVFMSRREENWDIYVINADGSNLQRLTEDPSNDGLPAWSPDGNAIAFVSNRGGPWAVWAMTPDGAGKRQLFTMEGSPDGFVGVDTYASRGWAEERISWTASTFD
ncbi:MAG: PD40 domain-containing protein [Anaerolineae bacterium]|nr:PD40 domain-containing protein [Anaerolineae bacterium]